MEIAEDGRQIQPHSEAEPKQMGCSAFSAMGMRFGVGKEGRRRTLPILLTLRIIPHCSY